MNRREFLCCAGCAGLAMLTGCMRTQPATAKIGVAATPETPAKPEDFAYCGVDCKTCDVFKATIHGDGEARRRAAKQFEKTAREHWGMKTLDPTVLDCKGCRAGGKQHHGYGRCPMRPCAQKRGLASCGLCPEWETCTLLRGVFADEPQAENNLRRVAQAAKRSATPAH